MNMTWRTSHRVMAVSVGFIFLLWIVSGVIMVMPQLRFATLAPAHSLVEAKSFRGLSVSPFEAIKAVENASRRSVEVISIQLRPIAGAMVYEISAGTGESYLIDARTGEMVTITEQMARAIAQALMVDGVRVESATLVTSYGAGYASGPLPVYRLEMSDSHASIVYVSTHNGAGRYTNRWIRIREALEGLHSFDPVEWVTGSSLFRKGLLLLGSLIGGVVACTGYVLALRRG